MMTARNAATSLRRRVRRATPLLTMVSPVTVWMVILIAVPLVYVLVISFCSTDESHHIVFSFTVQNYAKLFDPTLLSIYGNSLLIAGLSCIISILVGYPFATIMANSSPFRRTLMMAFLMLPFWTNSLIRLYGWRSILGNNGFINSALQELGLITQPLELLYNHFAVILGMVYVLLPFMVLPIYTVILKLDHSLLEAASDLGARPARRFLKVTLPLTSSGIFAGSIMVFIPALGYFFVSNLMGGGTTQLIGNVIARQFKEAFNWPFGAALSIVLIVITLVLVRAYTKTGGKMDDLGAM
ncbi:MAG: ABC transporter permease [Coriobacteriales bacterium]|jgi:spermidine/putrescine transport system permease protein|nr:ABC transporter permease [Coriobacteriales bacterium]